MSFIRNHNFLIDICRTFALSLFMGAFLSFPAHSGYAKSFKVAIPHGKVKSQRISPTIKYSKFLTGLAAGTILLPQKGHTDTYNKPDFESPDGELFREYERNNQLLARCDLSQGKRAAIERRNQQIINKLIALAEKRYMSAFKLELTPLKEKIIESTIERSNHEKPDLQVNRKQIVYELEFSDESPKPISDFEVVAINEMQPNSAHPYQFNYSEIWGNNTIKVTFRDKKDYTLVLNLSHSYYVPKAKRTDILASMREKFEYTWPLMLLLLMATVHFFNTKQ